MPTVVAVDEQGNRFTADYQVIPSLARFGRVDYANRVTDPSRYAGSVVVAQANAPAGYVAGLKAAGVTVLMYQAMIAVTTDTTGIRTMTPWSSSGAPWPGGIPTNYFLLDGTGAPQFSTNFGGMYFMDFGLPAYQQSAVAHAVGQAKRLGFDGVFFDGIDTALGLGGLQAGQSASIANNGAYVTALTGFLAYAGQQFHANGLVGMANIGGAYQSDAQAGLWKQWSGLLDGALEEFFAIGWKGAVLSAAQVGRQLGNLAWSEANGRMALLNQDDTTQQHNVYGLALALMVAGGQTVWDTADGGYSGGETWWPDFTAAQALGAPLGPFSQSGSVLSRRFVGGVVTADLSTQAGVIP